MANKWSIRELKASCDGKAELAGGYVPRENLRLFYKHLNKYFKDQEGEFGEHGAIPWRRILEPLRSTVYSVNSEKYGDYIAFVSAIHSLDYIVTVETTLVFPIKDEDKEKGLVNEIREYVAEQVTGIKLENVLLNK